MVPMPFINSNDSVASAMPARAMPIAVLVTMAVAANSIAAMTCVHDGRVFTQFQYSVKVLAATAVQDKKGTLYPMEEYRKKNDMFPVHCTSGSCGFFMTVRSDGPWPQCNPLPDEHGSSNTYDIWIDLKSKYNFVTKPSEFTPYRNYTGCRKNHPCYKPDGKHRLIFQLCDKDPKGGNDKLSFFTGPSVVVGCEIITKVGDKTDLDREKDLSLVKFAVVICCRGHPTPRDPSQDYARIVDMPGMNDWVRTNIKLQESYMKGKKGEKEHFEE